MRSSKGRPGTSPRMKQLPTVSAPQNPHVSHGFRHDSASYAHTVNTKFHYPHKHHPLFAFNLRNNRIYFNDRLSRPPQLPRRTGKVREDIGCYASSSLQAESLTMILLPYLNIIPLSTTSCSSYETDSGTHNSKNSFEQIDKGYPDREGARPIISTAELILPCR